MVLSVKKWLLTFILIAIAAPSIAGAQTNPRVGADTAGGRFFNSAGVRIRYVDRGSGEPIVLVHGYTGSLERHFVQTGLIARLEQDHRVLALDLRGHGGSDKPHEPSAYGAEMGQDVVRLLDHLGIRRAHIVGYSLGAHIAAQLLTWNPERFATATLIASAPWRQWTRATETGQEAAALELESDVPFRSLIVRLSPPDRPPLSEEAIRAASTAMAARNDVRALAALQRGFRSLVVSDSQLAAVRVPTLGIVGSFDDNRAPMQELKTVWPGMELTIVEGADHGGPRGIVRRPELVDALRRHVESNGIRP